jgi:3-O-methylgallate 3,4-dioxygenase
VAKIVLGVASSHSPQVSLPSDKWNLLREKDERDGRLNYKGLLASAKPGIENELTRDKCFDRFVAIQKGIEVLEGVLRCSRPDVIVILGDDQHEQFHDDNMPTFAIFHGQTFTICNQVNPSPWKKSEATFWAEAQGEYDCHAGLAEYIIHYLTEMEFDVSRSNAFRKEGGVGHAFSFLYRRILPHSKIPIVPVMVNTYYPPNQPTPKRCYEFGVALRHAIESWNTDLRVAVVASGGLSHVIVDEKLDRQTIGALMTKNKNLLFKTPREKLCGGTSEILCWIALAGIVESMQMFLVDYIPAYRSPAATGCGIAFAYWT